MSVPIVLCDPVIGNIEVMLWGQFNMKSMLY